ncbi:hypothetical protein M422DRAFT_269596 [Sphaerobolus stellatus SS14]|uniref:Uncharacterized protein n=1 Tax=Sphaerobolus stellatus (strain SS14) TaxID=990650 RepID=A0A0C9THU3_SPHS4|nr:hypothetical protein M422DRAFT_269596 [Sphaerobolus stellatus SS14]
MATGTQPGNTTQSGLAPRTTRHTSNTPMPIDTVDPLSILADKGITQQNRMNIDDLAAAIESFGNFRKPDGRFGTTTAPMANTLQAVAVLLREAARQQINNSITKDDLLAAVSDIKATISSSLVQPKTTYAQALSGAGPTVSDPHTMLNTNIKDRQILISTRNVAPGSTMLTLPTRTLTDQFNDTLKAFFAQPQHSAYSMSKPIRGIFPGPLHTNLMHTVPGPPSTSPSLTPISKTESSPAPHHT